MTADASLPLADVQYDPTTEARPLSIRVSPADVQRPVVKPWGIQCFGCNRRFVGPGTPTSGPLDAVAWEEGLCGKASCPVWDMMGIKKR